MALKDVWISKRVSFLSWYTGSVSFYSSSCRVFERVTHSLSFHCDTTTVLDVSIMYIGVLKRHFVPGARVLRKIDRIPSCLISLCFVRCILACEGHSELD
jgi:hypothetical protein